MKVHTNNYKNQIKEFGKQIDSKITYTINGTTITLGTEQLNSVTPHYESNILKSTMKQLDLDSNVYIAPETVINYQFGLLVNGTYEYINYGNYVVYEVEKQEDTRSWKITCYDKMLYAMKPYENMNITYPITVKNFIGSICTQLGLTLADGDFVNEDKEITEELYLDSEGNTLDYTYRDVLDELAQVTASTICINENDELEVRYVNNTGEHETVTGTNFSLENVDDGKDIEYDLKGNTVQDGTPTPSSPIAVENVTGRQEIVICKKNLFNKDTTNIINANLSNSTINSSASERVFFMKCKPNTTYTFTISLPSSYKRNTIATTTSYPMLNMSVDNAVYSSTAPKTYTTGANAEYIVWLFYSTSNPDYTEQQTKDSMQIEEGNQATTYEPFKGNSYEINLGKNLFDKNTMTTRIYGYLMENLTTWAVATGGYSIRIPCEPNSNYTISANNPNETVFRAGVTDSNNTPVSGTTVPVYSVTRYSNTNVPIYVTTGANAKYIVIQVGVDTASATFNTLQLEKGRQATSYAEYKEPIELCKIGNYQDFIAKGTGKNLFDGEIELGGISPGDGSLVVNTSRTRSKNFIKVKPNTTYTFTRQVGANRWIVGYNKNQSGITDGNYNNYASAIMSVGSSVGSFNFTTTSTTEYIKWYDTSSTDLAEQIQLEEGTQATYFEPFNAKGKWLLHKEIDKIVLNGSETWYGPTNTKTNTTRYYISGITNILNNQGLCNCATLELYSNRNAYDRINFFVGDGSIQFRIDKLTLETFKNWLSSNNIEVYYVLATPITTEITDTELLNQLNSIELLEGLNNINLTSGTLSTPLTLTYLSELETIDEEYLKDVNVNFGEKYGKVNSVVLSRSAESDNIYRSDEESIEENGLTEIKIKDNQILNGNNRDEYIDGIFNQLNGLEYYINDFKSTGITYLDLLDKYKVKVEENYYKCIMLNDELDVTQGIEEQVYAEMPEETETDYTHASKTDRTINQAYIIAKKNDAEIQALAKKVVDVSDTITGIGSVTLENAHNGVIHRIEITGNISRLMPSNTLTPSNSLHPIDVCLLVDEDRYYLDIDYLVYNSIEEHDTFICEDGKCWIERINGTIEEKNDIYIYVDSNSEIRMEYFDNARIKCIYLLQNDYTDVFSNEATVSSELNLLANSFEAKVSEVTDTEGNITSSSIILAINNDVSSAVINADKISLEGKEINLTSEDIKIQSDNFSLDENGNMECNNAKINGGEITLYGGTQTPKIKLINPTDESQYSLYSSGILRFMNNEVSRTYLAGTQGLLSLRDSQGYYTTFVGGEIYLRNELEETPISMTARTGNITCISLTQTSKAEEKKNFEKLENALDIIENTDIYQYHLKRQNDNEKKHIGFIIGDEYNYSEKITSQENDAVDVYSFVAVCCQAIKELKKEIEDLKKEMNK